MAREKTARRKNSHLHTKILKKLLARVAKGDEDSLRLTVLSYWWLIKMLAETGTPPHAHEHLAEAQLETAISEFIETARTFGENGTDCRYFPYHVCTNVLQNESFRGRYWVYTLTETGVYAAARLQTVKSLDAPVREDSDMTFIETLCTDGTPPDTAYWHTQAREVVAFLLEKAKLLEKPARLTSSEHSAVVFHFLCGLETDRTAKLLALSNKKVREKFRSGMRKLEHVGRMYPMQIAD